MQHFIGNNDFEKCFDFYKWSAPFFDTPKDVVRYVDSLGLSGKILKRINVIGCGYDPGRTNNGLLYRKLKEAGFEPQYDENDINWYRWYENYPNKDKILVPWSVRLCEPIQFVFEDNTTFEILPTESGGARIGVNSIPADISDGLNRSDFNGDIFFEEILGRKFEFFSMRVIETGKHYIDTYSLDSEKPYIETRHEYLFRISFGYPYKMTFVQTFGSWYRAELAGSGHDVNVPYSRVLASKIVHADDQIMIINGRDTGGTFRILPISLERNSDEKEWLIDGYGISIDEGDVEEFLTEFLYRFFDPKIQERDEYDSRSFDWYGGNLFTFDALKTMLEEIRVACWLLENDYDNSVLSEVKSHFSWHYYTEKHKSDLTENELNELRKNRVPAAVDFYNRFCTRMENMMMLPGKNAISFAGP